MTNYKKKTGRKEQMEEIGTKEALQFTFTIKEVSGVEGVPMPLRLEARGIKVLAYHVQV